MNKKETAPDFLLKDDAANIFSLILLLLNSKLKIFTITSLALLVSIIYSFYLPNLYSTSASLKLTEGQEETSQLSQMASKYGGLASMAGLSVPGGNSNGFYVVEKIKSLDFLSHLLTFESIKEKLVYNREESPSILEIYDIYSESLSIFISKDTNFIQISFIHPDPIFAKYFVELIVREINDISRKKDLNEAENSILYLKEQLSLTQQSSIKQSINILIEKELKTKMFGNIRNDYIVEYIDAPFLPEKRYSPKRSLIGIIGIMIGLFISLIFIIVTEAIRQNKK